jgi:GGDEF domain-containing protein
MTTSPTSHMILFILSGPFADISQVASFLRRAGELLYQAKEQGRNRTVCDLQTCGHHV